jgi:hypothetical protein
LLLLSVGLLLLLEVGADGGLHLLLGVSAADLAVVRDLTHHRLWSRLMELVHVLPLRVCLLALMCLRVSLLVALRVDGRGHRSNRCGAFGARLDGRLSVMRCWRLVR